MKFTVERAVLIKALAHVQSVVERRNTIPILANVLLAAQDDSLRLTATDMEIAVVEEVPGVRVARPGRTTAPAATLYEIVRKLPEGALVELEQGGGEAPLKLRAGRFHTDLAVLPVEDFPSMTEGKLPHRFTLGAGQMRDLVDRTRFAISHGRDALLPERHLPARRRERRRQGAARGRHRRPPPRPLRGEAAGGRGRHSRA